MGIFDGLMGNASETDAKELQEELAQLLAPNERVERAFRVVRDLIVFTDKRMVLVDKQGVSKKEFVSVPYRSITRFSVETAGTFDMEAELKVWVSGTAEPLQHTFKRGSAIAEVQRVLATFVLR
jgi:hypothetical protein